MRESPLLSDESFWMLSNTSLKVKVQGAETEFFESNIGSPQGGSLSGKLFKACSIPLRYWCDFHILTSASKYNMGQKKTGT